MIVMHGETLWSPAPQPMDDDDDDDVDIDIQYKHQHTQKIHNSWNTIQFILLPFLILHFYSISATAVWNIFCH